MGKSSRKKHHATSTQHPSQTPMSAALIDLAAPVLDFDMPLEVYRSLISLAAVAWNVAQFPKERRKAQLQAFLKLESGIRLSFDEIIAANSAEEVTEEPREGMNLIELIKSMVHRKDLLFPNDRRFVVNYDVSWKNDRPNVTASYIPLPDTFPDMPADA